MKYLAFGAGANALSQPFCGGCDPSGVDRGIAGRIGGVGQGLRLVVEVSGPATANARYAACRRAARWTPLSVSAESDRTVHFLRWG